MAVECASTYGQAAELVCQRLADMGWNPSAGAGWFSTLAAVMAGFVFSAIVIVLTPQSPFMRPTKSPVDAGASLPVFLGSFLSLLSASFLFVLVSSETDRAKILPAAGLAAAVFGAGAVQTFVAITWLAAASPLAPSATGCLSVAVRFVMFSTGLHVLVTVVKAQWIFSGHLNPPRMALAVALLAGPWLTTRVLVRPGAWVARWNGRLQMISFRLSISFVGLASVAFMFAVDRGSVPRQGQCPTGSPTARF